MKIPYGVCMRTLIRNLFIQDCINLDGRLPLKNYSGHDLRGKKFEAATFTFAATASAITAAAVTGAITAAAVFCFEDDNIPEQDGARSVTNYCRRLFAQ